MARKKLALTITVFFFFLLGTWLLFPSATPSPLHASSPKLSKTLLHGTAIMPHLGNETLKAELGRASWKVLHTTLARYPKRPSTDEREALGAYLHLFARLYPCGECAKHFTKILQQYPPQTSSRDAASQWGCYVHNLVNERLKKPVFDCGSVTETYKCGCADEDARGGGGEDAVVDVLTEKTRGARVEVQMDGLMNGG